MQFLILIPAVTALLRLITGKYPFSALTSLCCAALAAFHAPWMAAGLVVSTVGDWFLAHQKSRAPWFCAGVIGFLIGHCLFIADAAQRLRLSIPLLTAGIVLLAGFSVYFLKRVLPGLPGLLRLPVALYAFVSVAGFTCAMMTGDALYAVGIGFLLFSDTLIAEDDFAGNHRVRPLVLPTYYLCHILIALSAMLR